MFGVSYINHSMCLEQHTRMRSADEHPFFDGMSGRWRAYISTLREFEQKCCDLDKCDLVNECFTTNLAQTNADEFDTLFIRQLQE